MTDGNVQEIEDNLDTSTKSPEFMEEFKGFSHMDSGGDEEAPDINEGCHDLNELANTVDEEAEPKVGMVFDTADKAYTYYNGYARRIGFSVRKQRTNMNKVDRSKIHRQLLVCACEGAYRKIKTPQKRRENRRFDCKAVFEIKLIRDKYHVIQFKSEHSHDLVPPQHSQYLRSQRKIEFSQAGLINKMHSPELKNSNIFSCMCENDIDPSFTTRFTELSHISQRIVTKGSKIREVSSLTKAALLELEAKVELWTSSMEKNSHPNQMVQNSSTANLIEEAPLLDPPTGRCQGQTKGRENALEAKGTKKICKGKGGETGDLPTTQTMTGASQPSRVAHQEMSPGVTFSNSTASNFIDPSTSQRGVG